MGCITTTGTTFVDDSESKSPSKNDDNKTDENKGNDGKFELSHSIYLEPRGKREKNEFNWVGSIFESTKTMVDSIVKIGCLSSDDILLVKNTICMKYKEFNYQIEQNDYKLHTKDEQAMESGMQLYYNYILFFTLY